MNFRCGKTVVTVLAAGLVLSVLAEAVQARPGHRYVTAQSRYGNGSATGRVRIGPRGYLEVQLPSGRWEDCEGNCARALREKHLDFWETIDENSHSGR